MTDRLAALATLSLHDGAERDRAFADFYARYATNALVVDKWFSLQAMTPQPGTLEKVRGLTEHPAFSFANPNRLRALIGAFAQGNPTQFNRADGAGYAFVAENVLALDPKNPQLAARLATAFRSWRIMEAGRRTKAQDALERIKRVARTFARSFRHRRARTRGAVKSRANSAFSARPAAAGRLCSVRRRS